MDLTVPEVKAIIDQIDKNVEGMVGILKDESEKLTKSFEGYLWRIRKMETRHQSLSRKLENAQNAFRNVHAKALAILELQAPLNNILEVNKLVRYASHHPGGQNLVKISSYLGAIANICLAQLKQVRNHYDEILKSIKKEMTRLWMDRELSEILQLILSVSQHNFNRFLALCNRTEVLYADISIDSNKDKEELGQHIVLRMVSNRLPSCKERKIINTLFPTWKLATN